MNRTRLATLRQVLRDRRGLAVIEFALILPLLILLTFTAIELVNYVMVRQQISQLALQVADNASRIGTQNSIQTQIDEKQVNDLFIGAGLQASGLDIVKNGRIILSSLETSADPAKRQVIHWQRCYGAFAFPSSYGKQGDANLASIGPSDGSVKALTDVPAMFVEVGYQYQPLVMPSFIADRKMKEVAAMLVRDTRDTSGAGINPVQGVKASTC